LAQKAGKVVSGEFMTEKAVKTGEAALVILAEDASDNTKKKFQNMCEFYQVTLRIHAGKDILGHAMGKELRASLAVTDEGLAQAIMKKMD
jgi:ribosomal protein L7Ae-like RNA K-turn-binding protein